MVKTNNEDLKTAIVVSRELQLGLAANAISVLSVTLGVRLSNLVGDDVTDASGRVYPGIMKAPVPVLQADGPTIAASLTPLFAKSYSLCHSARWPRAAGPTTSTSIA